MSIELQSSDTPNGGRLLAAYGSYIIILFKVVKTRFITTLLAKVSGILKQLLPNMRHIAQLIATAVPLNALYNIPLHETLQNGKNIRMRGEEDVNINKAYNNKYQYIKARPNRVAWMYIFCTDGDF